MIIGNTKIEIVWPGWFLGTPGLLLMIAMPCVLLFALYKYTSISKVRKIAFTPFCILGPFLIYSLWPLLLSLSHFVMVSAPDGTTRANYSTMANLFGVYSEYVWTLLTGVIVYMIYLSLRKKSQRLNS